MSLSTLYAIAVQSTAAQSTAVLKEAWMRKMASQGLRLGCGVLLVVLVSACSLFREPSVAATQAPTLAELPTARAHLQQLREQQQQQVPASQQALLAQVSQAYHEALALASEPAVRQEIQQRLAHIDLQIAEERQINDASADPKALYRNAIDAYQALLLAQQQAADTGVANAASQQALDQLLYPLAKAYEMSGDIPNALAVFDRLVTEVPDSQYYSEAQFRRGEIHFAAGEYRAAGRAYRAVINRAHSQANDPQLIQDTPFLLNAWYMAGWSDFKLARYSQALTAFFMVMDSQAHRLGNNAMFDSATIETTPTAASAQSIIDDTLRVMSLAFSYESGATTIAGLLDQLYSDTAEPVYVDRLYSDLAGLYLEKKRFADSAGSYAAFIERYPNSVLAPDFHVQMIDVYVQAGFADRVRNEKENYVNAYGVRSDYWQKAGEQRRQGIQADLNVYINELASYYHNLAQTGQRNGKPLADDEVRASYRQAGDWYEEWIASVPNSPELDRIWFLLGETRFESHDYISAINAYENAAYGEFGFNEGGNEQLATDTANDQPAFDQHNDAAYAALLAYDQLIATADGESLAKWQNGKNDSALLFAQTFTNDPRSIPVLAQATESLLSLQQFEKTVAVGQQLLDRLNADSENTLNINADDREQFLVTGGLAIGHAQRELGEHALAEQAYYRVLVQIDSLAARPASPLHQQYYSATLDNYAASIYQQGVTQMDAGEAVLAADSFMRVVTQAPGSSIRVSAQRDAAALLMQTSQWQRAIDVMTDFQQRFPNHEDNAGIPARLLVANESLENWSGAATQAMVMAQRDSDPEVRRQALYSAAEFYQRAGDNANAIESYKQYAHSYAQPLAENMEAQYTLTRLYAESGQRDKRAFWIKKMMNTHDSAATPTERSRYLAAFAATDIAERQLLSYQAVNLKHPLKTSLAKKRKAMQQALTSYQHAASYDVEQFSTQSTHRIGEIYASLAADLLASERPAGLNELELEQYNFLLEEQAYPFEESAIEFYTVNVERAWQGIYGQWITESYQALAQLLPGRFDKTEIRPEER